MCGLSGPVGVGGRPTGPGLVVAQDDGEEDEDGREGEAREGREDPVGGHRIAACRTAARSIDSTERAWDSSKLLHSSQSQAHTAWHMDSGGSSQVMDSAGQPVVPQSQVT